MPQLTSLWCVFYNICTRFCLFHVTEEWKVVTWQSSIRKVFLKVPQNSQENICAEVSFAISCRLEGYNFIKYRIWYQCFPVNLAKSLRTSILQTSATACLWRVGSLLEFRKILGFYYKPNKQLFYCEGTLSFIPLKIDERVNRVIFQNSSELLHLKIPQQTKTDMFKTTKECFRNVI